MKGRRNVFVCLIWEEPLLPNSAVCYGTRTWGDRAVIIVSAMVAILSSSTSVSKKNMVQRSAFAETTCSCVHQKLLQLLNGEMSWKENSSLLGLWTYHRMKHAVPQNGEFIAINCWDNDNDIYASAPLLASLFATTKFLSLFLLCHY